MDIFLSLALFRWILLIHMDLSHIKNRFLAITFHILEQLVSYSFTHKLENHWNDNHILNR